MPNTNKVIALLGLMKDLYKNNNSHAVYQSFERDILKDIRNIEVKLKDLRQYVSKVEAGRAVNKTHEAHNFVLENASRIKGGFESLDYIQSRDPHKIKKAFQQFQSSL